MTKFEKLLERSILELTDEQVKIVKEEIKGVNYDKDDYLKALLDEATTSDSTGRQNIYKIYLTKELDDDKYNNCDRYICTV